MTAPLHACITERQRDESAYREQYLVRCRCHQREWRTWRPGDPPLTCPESGVSLTPDSP